MRKSLFLVPLVLGGLLIVVGCGKEEPDAPTASVGRVERLGHVQSSGVLVIAPSS